VQVAGGGRRAAPDSRMIRALTIVDTFWLFSPVIDPRFSYRAQDVVAKPERICAQTGYPKTIRVDLGSEFVSRDLDLWANAKGVALDFPRSQCPTAVCLQNRETLEARPIHHNEVRPHGAIGNKPPISLQKSGGAPGQLP